jgi:hypothetical protein
MAQKPPMARMRCGKRDRGNGQARMMGDLPIRLEQGHDALPVRM